MQFLIENWATLILAVLLIGHIVYDVINFKKLPKDEQYQRIRGWLLQAVLLAERDFGSGTGSLKLSTVYAEFCKQLPWLAQVIPFNKFSDYVDDALAEMKEMLKKNKKLAEFVEGDVA